MPSGRSNLENLARAKQLNAEPPVRAEIDGLLKRARAQLGDARNPELNITSRFTLAYGAAHTLALAALRNAGYRPSSAGHRKVVFQTLDTTVGATPELWVALDRYHDKRNRHEYEAADISTLEAEDMINLADQLEVLVMKRVQK